MKPIIRDDILQYRALSGLRYAPDGKRAAFIVANATDEGYEHRLWLYEDNAVRQLTDLGKESSFVWLDENRLLFPAVRTEKEKKRAEAKEAFTTYYMLDLRGGEALPFLELPFRAEGIRVLDETHFAVTTTVSLDFPDVHSASDEARKARREALEADRDYEVLSELPFYMNGPGYCSRQRSRLFCVCAEPFSVTPLTTPPEDLQGITALGDELFFVDQSWQTRFVLQGFRMRAYNWRSGETREVCRSESLRCENLDVLGGKLLLTGTESKRHGLNENAWLYTVDPQSGEIALLRQEEYNLYNSVCSDVRYGGGRQAVSAPEGLYHLTTRGGNCNLHLLTEDGADRPILAKDGSVECFDVADGKILLVGLYDMRPQELYTYDPAGDALVRVSHFNDAALEGRYVAQPERLTVQSAGYEIEGWVLKPLDYDPAKRYPGVLDIHGGPKTAYGPVFFHEMQLWASMGYFVFFCNPKGSDGGTNEFMDIRGHYGETDYVNLMDFTDAVLAAYPQIDPARLCETGGSYGGFMTNWIIGHTDRFCCVASQRSISNFLGFYGTSDIGVMFAADQAAGDIYVNPEKLWQQSPLAYAANVKTPTLFIHADEDYRCPLSQGLQMFASLLDRGVETRLCLFHGENHELSRAGKPKHRLRRLQEISDWFDQHAK